jgi:hypothetical protein
MKRLLPVLVCLLAGKSVFAEAPETPQQELARAEVLERNHKHAEALALARKAAEAGLAEAWYWIGMNTTDADPAAFVKAAGLGYAPAFPFALDGVLFRAGHKADVTQAKHLADLARSRHVNLGYDSAAELQTIDRCFQAGEPNIPTKLSKDELALYSRPGTDCSVYRTGVGAANNYGKYLRCLLAQSPDDMNALAEIYANGWGVARDVKLAISLLCHASEVPAELIGMVSALSAGSDVKPKKDFLFCDFVTSGLKAGVCSAQAEHIAAARRKQELDALTSSWTSSQKKAFDELWRAAGDFFSTYASEDQDTSGTARPAIVVAAETRLRDEFLSALRSFEAGKLPPELDFKKSDRELNAVYARVVEKLKAEGYGAVGPESLRTTQKKWLAYRDAWAAFATVRYPGNTSEQWKAWATSVRVKQLQAVVGEEE